jgi:hypothetical protein
MNPYFSSPCFLNKNLEQIRPKSGKTRAARVPSIGVKGLHRHKVLLCGMLSGRLWEYE